MPPDESMSPPANGPTSEGKKQVLIVDRQNFAGLISKMLLGKYTPGAAADGLQAIHKLRQHPPDIIVVEQSIPGSGIKLAELVGISPKYSDIPVILMSADPSPDIIIRSRNAGVSSFLAKPFRPSELLSRITTALNPTPPPQPPTAFPSGGAGSQAPGTPAQGEPPQPEEKSQVSSIKDRVRKIEGLPPFPATYTQIMELVNSEESTSDEIAEHIQFDPDLLATVFKLVNSTYYGFRKKIDSLKLGVTLLGLEELANLIMAAQVFQNLGDNKEGAGLNLQSFWKHLVGTAFAARAIAKKLQTEEESAFLAAMLHDLGKVVLNCYFSDYYGAVLDLVQTEGMRIVDAEQEILGLNHADVGGQLAVEWKFSDKFMNTMLYHHKPRQSHRYQRLVCLIHLADALCRKLEYGSGGDAVVPEIDENVLERFSLREKGLQILEEAVQEDLQDADSFLAALHS